MKVTKPYIGFRVGNRNFCDITILKSGLKIWVSVPSSQLKDSLGIFRDVSKIGRWAMVITKF
jgi:predicted transport protein